MTEIAISEAVVNAISSVRSQVDIITSLSSGGLGVIVFTWARILGIFDDADFSRFRRPALLTLPVICFTIAVIAGYSAGGQITGYYLEVARGIDSCDGRKITDAQAHFFDSYDTPIYWAMAVQMYTSISGIVVLVSWFGWNIIGDMKARK